MTTQAEVKTGSTLLELAERCERATGPDRELDANIAAALHVKQLTYQSPEWIKDPEFTTSIDAAMTLVPEGLAMGFKMAPCQRAHAMLATIGEEWSGSGSTPALALCAASLRARAPNDTGV